MTFVLGDDYLLGVSDALNNAIILPSPYHPFIILVIAQNRNSSSFSRLRNNLISFFILFYFSDYLASPKFISPEYCGYKFSVWKNLALRFFKWTWSWDLLVQN